MFFFRWKVTWPVFTFRSYADLACQRRIDLDRASPSYLHVDLVAAKHDRDVLADTLEITVPVGHVLVRDARGDIEHDDAALALDVVAVAEATELLLPGGVPDVEADRAEVGREGQRVHLDTEGGWEMWRVSTDGAETHLARAIELSQRTNVFLLEFTRQVAL